MTELKEYVDGLFRHQYLTPELKDLKEEILSNMTAKRDDLLEQGIDAELAAEMAKKSLTSIDSLVDGNQLTDLGKYRFECAQTLLLHCILFWIFSLPLLLTACDIRRDLSLAGEMAGGGSCISFRISKPAARENGLAYMDRVFCGVYRDDGGADIWKPHLVRQADPHRRALSDDECGSTVLSAPAYDRDPRYIQQFYEEPEKMLCTGGTG